MSEPEVYVALHGAEYEGYVRVIGVYTRLEIARYESENYFKDQVFKPDFIKIIRAPLDINANDDRYYDKGYPVETLLWKKEIMVEEDPEKEWA